MNRRPGFSLGIALAIALTLVACVGAPGTAGRPGVKKSTSVAAKKVSPKPGASPSKKPSPVPSLGLLLEGKVTIEPAALVSSHLAQLTAGGAKIIANNSGGIISDNGLGIISDNGLGLISDNGLGLISNNSGSYRLQATAGGLKPVEGMWVRAVNLYDGKVLAGPVATKPDGSYKLGFIQAPKKNLRIEAFVPAKEPDPATTYETLTPPSPAPVLTSDTTRAVARMMIDALPLIFQPVVDKAKQNPVPSPNPNNPRVLLDLADLLIKAGPEKVTALDQGGALSRGMAERLVAVADLTLPPYQELYDVAEEARAFGDSLDPPLPTSLVDQVVPLLQHKEDLPKVIALFKQYGMPDAQAEDLGNRLRAKSEAVGQLLTLTLITHEHEVLDPLEALLK